MITESQNYMLAACTICKQNYFSHNVQNTEYSSYIRIESIGVCISFECWYRGEFIKRRITE